MTRVDRKLFRTQMKKEYKKFIKENVAYKHMTFSQFVELVKVNMIKLKKQTGVAQSVVDGHEPHDHDHDLQDMFASIEENDETASVVE